MSPLPLHVRPPTLLFLIIEMCYLRYRCRGPHICRSSTKHPNMSTKPIHLFRVMPIYVHSPSLNGDIAICHLTRPSVCWNGSIFLACMSSINPQSSCSYLRVEYRVPQDEDAPTVCEFELSSKIIWKLVGFGFLTDPLSQHFILTLLLSKLLDLLRLTCLYTI